MQKTISTYTINVLSTDSAQIGGQILFYGAGNIFSGRIDFYRPGVTPAAPYLWHPNTVADNNQIYLVLAMQMDQFENVCSLIRNEGPWTLELWPSTSPMVGATTSGYAGKLFTSTNEPIGEEERSFQSTVIKA